MVFLRSARGWVVGERSTPSWPPSATGVSPVRRMGDTLVAPAAWEPPHQNKFWHRREETAFHAHHRRQECRRSVGWATLLSPLLHESLPTKTSFGPDGKKQLSFPTNDLKKLFLERGSAARVFESIGAHWMSFIFITGCPFH